MIQILVSLLQSNARLLRIVVLKEETQAKRAEQSRGPGGEERGEQDSEGRGKKQQEEECVFHVCVSSC